MYQVFYGSDRKEVRDAATHYIEQNMPEGTTLTTLEAASYQEGQVSDMLGASSLFEGEEWFVFDVPSDNADFVEVVQSSLAELAESKNTFIILEGAMLAPAKKKYIKHAADMAEFSASKAERFNTFALAEALAGKDKRRLWVLLQEARLNGSRDEEIVGILWWQLKSLRLAAVTGSASEAGMKDFPYNKSKRALSKFTNGEVEKVSQSLLELYHDGHAGVRDMDGALEQWVLKL